MIQYLFDPHTEAAMHLIMIAIVVIMMGWLIDMVIANFKKNYRNDNDKR